MAIVEVTIVPLGTGSTSLSKYVADCHRVLKHRVLTDSGLTYQLTPMGTVIEGDLEEILSVIRTMHEVPFESGALRVSTTIKIDDRRDKNASIHQKMSSVTEKL